jgi:hypothetical protein
MKKKLKKTSYCKWSKEEIKKNIDAIYELTKDPKYVCKNCARVSRLKSNMCKPHQFNVQ